MHLALVACRQNDQFGVFAATVLEDRAIGVEVFDVAILHQFDAAIDDQFRTADVEVIAAAAVAVFQRPTRAILAEIKAETGFLQAIQQGTVNLAHLVGDFLVGQFQERQGDRGVHRRPLADIDAVIKLGRRLDIDDQGRAALDHRHIGVVPL